MSQRNGLYQHLKVTNRLDCNGISVGGKPLNRIVEEIVNDRIDQHHKNEAFAINPDTDMSAASTSAHGSKIGTTIGGFQLPNFKLSDDKQRLLISIPNEEKAVELNLRGGLDAILASKSGPGMGKKGLGLTKDSIKMLQKNMEELISGSIESLRVEKQLNVGGAIVTSSASSLKTINDTTVGLELTDGRTLRTNVSGIRTNTGIDGITYDAGASEISVGMNDGSEKKVCIGSMNKLDVGQLKITAGTGGNCPPSLLIEDPSAKDENGNPQLVQIKNSVDSFELDEKTGVLQLKTTDRTTHSVNLNKSVRPNNSYENVAYNNNNVIEFTKSDGTVDKVNLQTLPKISADHIVIRSMGSLDFGGTNITIGSNLLNTRVTALLRQDLEVVGKKQAFKVDTNEVRVSGNQVTLMSRIGAPVRVDESGLMVGGDITKTLSENGLFGTKAGGAVCVIGSEHLASGVKRAVLQLGGQKPNSTQKYNCDSRLQMGNVILDSSGHPNKAMLCIRKCTGERGTAGAQGSMGHGPISRDIARFGPDNVSINAPLTVNGVPFTNCVSGIDLDEHNKSLRLTYANGQKKTVELSGASDSLSSIAQTAQGFKFLNSKGDSIAELQLQDLGIVKSKKLQVSESLRAQDLHTSGISIHQPSLLFAGIDGGKLDKNESSARATKQFMSSSMDLDEASGDLVLSLNKTYESRRLGSNNVKKDTISFQVLRASHDSKRGAVQRKIQLGGEFFPQFTKRYTEMHGAQKLVAIPPELNSLQSVCNEPNISSVSTFQNAKQVMCSTEKSEICFTRPYTNCVNRIVSQHSGSSTLKNASLHFYTNGNEALSITDKQECLVNNKLYVNGAPVESSVKAITFDSGSSTLFVGKTDGKILNCDMSSMRKDTVSDIAFDSSTGNLSLQKNTGDAKDPTSITTVSLCKQNKVDFNEVNVSNHVSLPASISLRNPSTQIDTQENVVFEGQRTGTVGFNKMNNVYVDSDKISLKTSHKTQLESSGEISVDSSAFKVNGAVVDSSVLNASLTGTKIHLHLSNANVISLDIAPAIEAVVSRMTGGPKKAVKAKPPAAAPKAATPQLSPEPEIKAKSVVQTAPPKKISMKLKQQPEDEATPTTTPKSKKVVKVEEKSTPQEKKQGARRSRRSTRSKKT